MKTPHTSLYYEGKKDWEMQVIVLLSILVARNREAHPGEKLRWPHTGQAQSYLDFSHDVIPYWLFLSTWNESISFLAASVLSHLSCYFSNCPINGQCCDLTGAGRTEKREQRHRTGDTGRLRSLPAGCLQTEANWWKHWPALGFEVTGYKNTEFHHILTT